MLAEYARRVAELCRLGRWEEACSYVDRLGFDPEGVPSIASIFGGDMVIDKLVIRLSRDFFQEQLDMIKRVDPRDRRYDPSSKTWIINNPQNHLDNPLVRARYADLVAQMELPIEGG